uniref:Uncharacterized protein n=1 Tax=Ditylenchus dipsaci TaxID=166011 RepID=A0A915D3L5_9BILA
MVDSWGGRQLRANHRSTCNCLLLLACFLVLADCQLYYAPSIYPSALPRYGQVWGSNRQKQGFVDKTSSKESLEEVKSGSSVSLPEELAMEQVSGAHFQTSSGLTNHAPPKLRQ